MAGEEGNLRSRKRGKSIQGIVMLKIKNLRKHFGNLKAVDGVSLELEPGEITGLIGPNGSGKTTLFNVVTGFYSSDGGKVFLGQERIDGLDSYKIARKGLVRTFQVPRITDRMTTLENMMFSTSSRVGETITEVFFRPGKVNQAEKKNLDKAVSLLEEVELKRLANEYAGNLSGGQQKLLSFARVFMNDPKVILLDEPTAGVNPTLANHLLDAIESLRKKEGVTVFLVEHNMDVISRMCNHVIVMNFGKKIMEGTMEEVRQNDQVLESYLRGAIEATES